VFSPFFEKSVWESGHIYHQESLLIHFYALVSIDVALPPNTGSIGRAACVRPMACCAIFIALPAREVPPPAAEPYRWVAKPLATIVEGLSSTNSSTKP
jgi:hypothetical protein